MSSGFSPCDTLECASPAISIQLGRDMIQCVSRTLNERSVNPYRRTTPITMLLILGRARCPASRTDVEGGARNHGVLHVCQ